MEELILKAQKALDKDNMKAYESIQKDIRKNIERKKDYRRLQEIYFISLS